MCRMPAVRHLDAIREDLQRAGADALWVHPSPGLRHLTGLQPLGLERPTALVILAGGGLRAVAPLMLAPELAAIDGADVVAWTDDEGPAGAIATALDGVGRCLVDPYLPAGVAFALRAARPGLDVALDPGILAAWPPQGAGRARAPSRGGPRRRRGGGLDRHARPRPGGASGGSPSSCRRTSCARGAEPYGGYIVASGANGALPHHPTGDDPIDPAAPLLTDFGCIVGGYHSDITRMYLPAGVEAEAEVEEALALVRAAHDAVIAGLAPGMTCHEADALARDVIAAAGHGDRFLHRTGHGVGLEIHEEPYLRPGNHDVLAAGDVFSVEPGIYFPGRFGVRYENLVHLGADGPELLNRDPRAGAGAA